MMIINDMIKREEAAVARSQELATEFNADYFANQAEAHKQMVEWLSHYRSIIEIVLDWNEYAANHEDDAMNAVPYYFKKIIDTFKEYNQ